MPVIFVIGGLIVLIIALRSGNDANGAASSGRMRNGSGGSMPDPGTNQALMVGSVSAHVPSLNAITPFSGTAKLAPDQAIALLNGANRVAAFGVGSVNQILKVPPSPSVRTTNTSLVPYSAISTNAIQNPALSGAGFA